MLHEWLNINIEKENKVLQIQLNKIFLIFI